MKKKKAFFINAFVLIITSLSMRSIGMLLQVYVSNQIGAVGIGLYSLITNVYGFALTFAMSGISLACTRLVAQELALKHPGGVKRVMRYSIGYSILFGSIAAVALFFGAPWISEYFLQDMRACVSLKILAVSLPAMAISSAVRGYFTAVRRVYKNAITEVLEQLLKVLFIVLLLPVFVKQGIETACSTVVFASLLAELLSFVVTYLLYIIDKRRYNKGKEQASKGLLKQLLSIGLPIAVSNYVRSALSTLNHLLIPSGLRRYGNSSETALAQYGMIGGMALPVVNFPLAFIFSFTTLLIPEVTESYAREDHRQVERIIHKVLHCTAVFSIGMAGMFYVFSAQLGQWLYHQQEPAIYIKILAPLVIVMYMDIAVDSILKGINKQLNSMEFNIIDSAVSLGCIYVFLPRYGIYGYLMVIFISEILNFILSLRCLLKATHCKIDFSHWMIRPFLSAIAATIIVNGGFRFRESMDICSGIITILLWFAVYVTGLWISNSFPFFKGVSELRQQKKAV